MHGHLTECFENEEIRSFPGPQENEGTRLVGAGDEVEIVIPALWHKPPAAKMMTKAPPKTKTLPKKPKK